MDETFESYAELKEFLLKNPEYRNYLDELIDNIFSEGNTFTLDNFTDMITTFGYNINKRGNYHNDSGKNVPPILKLAEYQDTYYLDIFCKLGAKLNGKYFKSHRNLIVSVILGHGSNWIFNKGHVIECVEILINNGCEYDNTFKWSEYISDITDVYEYYSDNELITSIIKNIFEPNKLPIKFAGKTC